MKPTVARAILCVLVSLAPWPDALAGSESDSGPSLRSRLRNLESRDSEPAQRLLADALEVVESDDSKGDRVAALAIAGEVLWGNAPDRFQEERERAMRGAVELAQDSTRAQVVLRTTLMPPLHRAAPGEREANLDRYRDLVGVIEAPEAVRALLESLAHVAALESLVAWGDAIGGRYTPDVVESEARAFLDQQPGAGGVESALGRLACSGVGDGFDLDGLSYLNGSDVQASDLRGRVTIITFWSSWCLPCLRAVPEEREMLERVRGLGIQLIGACGDDTPEKGTATAARVGIEWPSIWAPPAPGSLVERLCVEAWPSALILDREGRIRHVYLNTLYTSGWTLGDVERDARLLATQGEAP